METGLIKKEVARMWDKWAISYDDQYAHGLKSGGETAAWLDFLKQEMGTEPKKVLDVGTGTGFLALLAAELGHLCTGIDISGEMLEIAGKKIRENRKISGKVTFIYGDAEKLPFPDSSYDMVVNRHLLWTLPHPEQALSEWHRVLKPGGKILIINGVWSTFGWLNRALSLLGHLLIAAQERKNPWSSNYPRELIREIPLFSKVKPESILAFVTECGFKNAKLVKMDDVEKEEKAAMPLRYRLAYRHERYAVTGLKQDL